ncbi:hypothetical protein, partial [Plasmodium yoelii yoelii]
MNRLNLLFKLYHRRTECNYSTSLVGNSNHVKLKNISYNFYKNSKINNILNEENYENAIKISETISNFYKNKIYNNQSYILIFKGLMNILLKIKEEKKKKKIVNIMNIFVLYFKDHINIMNEQDITLLLDTNGK